MKIILAIFLPLFSASWAVSGGPSASQRDAFTLERKQVTIRQVDFARALYHENGYPKLDPAKLDAGKPPIDVPHTAIVLNNRFLRLTLLPEMGRVYSLYSHLTGHEQLWTNPVALPLTGQQNDLGWWLVLGGVEYTIPRGEHGTTWALPWNYTITEDSDRRKAVRMSVLEPRTHLKQTLEISLFPDRAFYEADIAVKNVGRRPARFSHWINPMWAPGGRGEITKNTEFIDRAKPRPSAAPDHPSKADAPGGGQCPGVIAGPMGHAVSTSHPSAIALQPPGSLRRDTSLSHLASADVKNPLNRAYLYTSQFAFVPKL